MTVLSIGWLGVRTENATGMISLFRDILALEVVQSDSTSTRFKLRDGTEVHVYTTRDVDHAFFGQGAVVGLRVESFALARATMLRAGIEFLYPEPQRQGGQAWQHFRGPEATCTRSSALTISTARRAQIACLRHECRSGDFMLRAYRALADRRRPAVTAQRNGAPKW
jgi:hypothetical protein